MRTLGRILIVVIVVSAVYLVIDFAGRVWAEAYVAGQVEKALTLDGKPDVTFGGPLFVPQFFGGELSSVTAKADEVTASGIAFRELTLKLEAVQFSPGKLLFHKDSTIVARSGTGSATMTDTQLTEAFQGQGVPITVFFTPEGDVRIRAARLENLAVVVSTTIENGDLVLRPTNPLFSKISFTLDVPELVPGMTYTKIEFDNQLGELSFRLDDATFQVQGTPE